MRGISIKARIFALLIALLLPAGGALAEVYAGTTVAGETVAVAAESGGTLGDVRVRAGETVAAGEALAELRTRKVYAAEDGTVARILAAEGVRSDGAVLELAPVSRYTILCSVDGAYQTSSCTRVHAGEPLYIRCTANGTHRGTGRITQIDGAEYTVEATGGELYVGEVVNLYRDADFTSSQRVGTGTVLASDVRSYEAQGYIVRLHVAEGEFVERGELLYEYAEGAQTELSAPESGIVTEAAEAGTALQAGQTAIAIAPLDQILVELRLDEAAMASLKTGDIVDLIYADDLNETVYTGAVEFISQIPENGTYAVRVKPEIAPARLGLTTYVRLPN